MAEGSTTQIQHWIDRLNAGDAAARDALIQRACERLIQLTRKMAGDFRRVKAFEETNDVMQRAVLRLLPALQTVPITSVAEFFRLAARQIRRELLDLARHYYGPQGMGHHQVAAVPMDNLDSTPLMAEPSDWTLEPERLALWREFHTQVERLPEKERDVFELVWYQGLTQPEAAQVLNVSLPTIERRWLSARLLLQEYLEQRKLEF